MSHEVEPLRFMWEDLNARRDHMSGNTLQDRANALAATHWLGGPPEDFEKVGRLQLVVLLQQGLRPDSRVLDVGCGCLRGGYWLMHFLNPGCYFGIEPNQSMLQMGLDVIMEPETLERAKPRFSHNERFDFHEFGSEFDFVLARSIWTHASKTEIGTMLDQFADTGSRGSVMMVSYIPADLFPALPGWRPGLAARLPSREYMGETWVGRSHVSDQAGVVRHSYRWIREQCRRRQLRVSQLRNGVINGQYWLRVERNTTRA